VHDRHASSPHTSAAATGAATSHQVSVGVTHQRVGAGALLLDVREPHEFAQGRADGAVNLPLSELQARYTELDASRRIAVICRSGNRSDLAAGFLRQVGFDAVNVVGGMLAWRREGLPMAASAPGGTS
jgi:rhodanese-related sulfurtransferase